MTSGVVEFLEQLELEDTVHILGASEPAALLYFQEVPTSDLVEGRGYGQYGYVLMADGRQCCFMVGPVMEQTIELLAADVLQRGWKEFHDQLMEDETFFYSIMDDIRDAWIAARVSGQAVGEFLPAYFEYVAQMARSRGEDETLRPQYEYLIGCMIGEVSEIPLDQFLNFLGKECDDLVFQLNHSGAYSEAEEAMVEPDDVDDAHNRTEGYAQLLERTDAYRAAMFKAYHDEIKRQAESFSPKVMIDTDPQDDEDIDFGPEPL